MPVNMQDDCCNGLLRGKCAAAGRAIYATSEAAMDEVKGWSARKTFSEDNSTRLRPPSFARYSAILMARRVDSGVGESPGLAESTPKLAVRETGRAAVPRAEPPITWRIRSAFARVATASQPG